MERAFPRIVAYTDLLFELGGLTREVARAAGEAGGDRNIEVRLKGGLTGEISGATGEARGDWNIET